MTAPLDYFEQNIQKINRKCTYQIFETHLEKNKTLDPTQNYLSHMTSFYDLVLIINYEYIL